MLRISCWGEGGGAHGAAPAGATAQRSVADLASIAALAHLVLDRDIAIGGQGTVDGQLHIEAPVARADRASVRAAAPDHGAIDLPLVGGSGAARRAAIEESLFRQSCETREVSLYSQDKSQILEWANSLRRPSRFQLYPALSRRRWSPWRRNPGRGPPVLYPRMLLQLHPSLQEYPARHDRT